MEQYFSVCLCGKPVGKVTVRKQGLYYRFSCKCSLSHDNIHRLMVSSGTTQENLGILVPQDDSFVLETKVPIKRIGEGKLSFHLVTKQETPAVHFIPIYPEEPFGYISRLKESFLTFKQGQPGIYIPKMQE